MAMPPVFNNNNNRSYFQIMLELTNEILNDYHIKIDVTGFEETINCLNYLDLNDYENAWTLSQELNAWSDYLSDIRSNCKRILNDLEAEKMATLADASIRADESKVSNGDRLANRSESVVNIRKKRNAIESLCDLLDAKIAYMERAHYMCKKTFEYAQITDKGKIS